MRLSVVPLELRDANAFVEANHRHHKRSQGHRFSIGAVDADGVLHACAIVGRPVSGLDPKRILEVVRMCSDGTPNACSILYSAAARAGQALGYWKIQTYIFGSENGSSLKASGWVFERKAHPSGRHRARAVGIGDTAHVEVEKELWSRMLGTRELTAIAHHRRKK